MARGQSDAVLRPLRVLLETGSVAGITDGELLERFAAHRDGGAETAFAALVSRHGPMVLGVCRHWLRDEHAADDAFQAVFLVLARRAGSIRRPELLSAWLHGVAVRIARKARAQAERRARREGREVAMSDVEAACPDPSRLQAEEVAAVHEEVGRLPERYRRAVVLCHFEGLTHAEAANHLGCAPGTVGSLVSRARDILRSRLTRRGLSSGAVLLAGSLEPRLVTAAVPPALERATIRAALIFTTNRAAAVGIASAAAVELAGGALRTMTMIKLTLVSAVLALGTFVTGAGGFMFIAPRTADPAFPRAQGQARPREEPARVPSPSLPGAMTQPPTWLVKDAPFDVAAFFAPPPPDENAAPRYLEALFEFGSGVAVCFPEGPEREGRTRATDERSKRFIEIDRALRAAPNSVPAEQIDAMVESYNTGFRKLDWAQQRPRCVFETPLGATAQVPHVTVARQVGRVTVLKVRRELERGEIDAALRDLARLLRLTRDLLPRGVMIVDMVSAAIDGVAAKDVIEPLLAAPGLTVAHCDRLLALLVEHEARSVDAYTEGLRTEYLSSRATLHDLVFDQDRVRAEWNRLNHQAGPSIVATIAEPELISALAPNAKMAPPGVGQQLKAMVDEIRSLKHIKDLDARIARTTPEELAKQVEKINELYGGLLGAANAPYPERIRKSMELPPALNELDIHTRVTRGIAQSAFGAFTQVLARRKATMRVAQGVVAVRRWQLSHDGAPPSSLDVAVKDAGWSRVPIDPYDDRPIRFAVVGGQPTVYSIGQDGRDDGGTVDNFRSPNSGDVLLRLPKP
jgi:RNA polymerase sigma factor (sigma-70 family)